MPFAFTPGPQGDQGWLSMLFLPLAGWNEIGSPSPSLPSTGQSQEQPVDNGREGGWTPESLVRKEPPIQEPRIGYKETRNILLLCEITELSEFICYFYKERCTVKTEATYLEVTAVVKFNAWQM